MKGIINYFRRRGLRKAQERYAYWRGRREILEAHIRSDWYFGHNSHNRDRAIHAAGKEAMFMERVEILMREQ